MTVGEYMDSCLEKYNLTDCVKEKNVQFSWVTFNRIEEAISAMNFARFLAECELISVRGNKDGSITCWF